MMVIKDQEAKDVCKSCEDYKIVIQKLESRIKELEAQLKAITEAE